MFFGSKSQASIILVESAVGYTHAFFIINVVDLASIVKRFVIFDFGVVALRKFVLIPSIGTIEGMHVLVNINLIIVCIAARHHDLIKIKVIVLVLGTLFDAVAEIGGVLQPEIVLWGNLLAMVWFVKTVVATSADL